jgi:hypothetical protein
MNSFKQHLESKERSIFGEHFFTNEPKEIVKIKGPEKLEFDSGSFAT